MYTHVFTYMYVSLAVCGHCCAQFVCTGVVQMPVSLPMPGRDSSNVPVPAIVTHVALPATVVREQSGFMMSPGRISTGSLGPHDVPRVPVSVSATCWLRMHECYMLMLCTVCRMVFTEAPIDPTPMGPPRVNADRRSWKRLLARRAAAC